LAAAPVNINIGLVFTTERRKEHIAVKPKKGPSGNTQEKRKPIIRFLVSTYTIVQSEKQASTKGAYIARQDIGHNKNH
jgi:hypothetical protein